MGIHRVYLGALAALSIWLTTPAVVHGQSAENVAVVVNDNSDDSKRIAEHYVRTRGVPAANVLRIQTSTDDAIERAEYVRTIERPMAVAIRRAGLQDRLLYIVLTKGVPLRISGTRGTSGTVASVDSELTLLYRRLVGTPVPVDGPVENPYYLGTRSIQEARPFTHREHDIYLVTRIDAYTVDQALSLIDRAQAPSREGRIVLDQRGTGGSGDEWMANAAARLSDIGQGARAVLESTPKPARNEPAALGYYSWSVSDPENRVRNTGMEFVPGAVAANLASFDARTFRLPPDDWRPTGSPDKTAWFEGSADALIGDLIRGGVTGVSGQVDEAYTFGAVRPEILFPAYLAGFNLAEAFYLAMPALSWQTLVVGDPLCAPFGRKPLTRDELEEPTDVSTGYPGLYGTRRAAIVLAANKDVPEVAAAPLMRSQALLDRDDRAGARRALEEVVKLAPEAVGPLVGLAQLEDELGESDTAIERYRRVLDLQPGNIAALNNLAYLLAVRRNAPAEALPFALAAAKAAPLNGVILDTVGWIHHLLGNHDLAAKFLEQAVRREPVQAEIRLHAAIVYLAAGNRAGAEAELKQALRIDPGLGTRADVQQLQQQLRR